MKLQNSPKVVLINPPSPWLLSDREQPRLGLLDIASFLRANNINVTFCDLAGLPENYWWIPDGDIYGVTCATPHYSLVIKIVKKIRDRQPNALVAVGGFHPTVEPARTLR